MVVEMDSVRVEQKVFLLVAIQAGDLDELSVVNLAEGTVELLVDLKVPLEAVELDSRLDESLVDLMES